MADSPEDEQERAWERGWRPPGYVEPDEDEIAFRRDHPGWLQAAWAHPDWPAWIAQRQEEASRR